MSEPPSTDYCNHVLLLSVSDEHKFKDSSSLYYRFTADDGLDEPSGKGKSPGSPQKQDIIRRLRELSVRKVDVSVWGEVEIIEWTCVCREC